MKTLRRGSRFAVAGATITSVLLLAGCGGQAGSGTPAEGGQASGQVRVDGSSTVAPLTSAAAELFKEQNANIDVTVATSGTGGGFEQFCSGNTDISNASRAIEDDETAACMGAGIEFTEMQVANDALSVVVNPANTFAQCLTVAQLATIWGPTSEGTVTNWNQVDPSFPSQPIALYGPGTDSGTFDYFTDAVNGEEGATRTDYSSSEDDNVVIQGVKGDPNATAYFGLSYVLENEGTVRAVQVDGGNGCVAPSAETVVDGTYTPLARPLFIYVNKAAFARPEVAEFVKFYASQANEIAKAADFVQLSEEQNTALQSAVTGISG